MPGRSPEGFGVTAIPSLAVTDRGIGVADGGAAKLLLEVHGQATHRWMPPAEPGTSGRMEVRVTDTGPRWRLVGAGTESRWLGLEAPFGGPEGPDPFGWWSVTCDIAEDVAPAPAARLVLRAGLTGVVLSGATLSPRVRDLLSREMADLMCEPLPSSTSEPLVWETRSIRQRRAIVRGHATSLVLPGQVRPGAAVVVAPPTVTALLVTRRPGFAALALRMLRDQTYPRLDIIIGLHGVSTGPGLTRVAADMRVPVDVMELPAAMTLGEVLGVVTERARGTFVTKVDDDDIYGPEHIWDLVIARALSGATVVGKGGEFVLLDQLGITVRRVSMASDAFNRVVAGGTMMMPRGELEALGGWRPVRSGVDRAFLDRVLHGGGTIYRTWPTGFIYRRHGKGHTWAPATSTSCAEPRAAGRASPTCRSSARITCADWRAALMTW